MGDQIGSSVDGVLHFIPYREFERIRNLDADKTAIAQVFANMVRINTLYMIARAGSGHIGSSFSSMEIVCWLLMNELRGQGGGGGHPRDVYFSSKGHDAPGYYSALIGVGRLKFELLHKLRRLSGLPGHPDIHTECIETNTGSLGMGVSKAKGMVIANRLLGRKDRVFVMTGDGELQEGQFWESLISAANHRFDEITVIIDHNKLQSDTFVSQVSDLGDLVAKLGAFGWHVERVDGNDILALARVFKRLHQVEGKPKIVVADTVKGRGVSFMEHTSLDSDSAMYEYHSGAPDADAYRRALEELIETVNDQLEVLKADQIILGIFESQNTLLPSKNAESLIAAYGNALVEQGESHSNLVALDADLVLDTGLTKFRERFPKRFFECGIAEQDMVSQAGGMALKGLLPIVHSFACFLCARANEQIYNNATEGGRIIYVGSLAGIVPGGPGHSHQSVRDISVLKSIPGLTLVEPCTKDEVEKVLAWCVNRNNVSSYIRLVSLPWPVPFALPADYQLEVGRGCALTEGSDAVLISSGPVMLSEAYKAAEKLASRGIGIKVVNLPWLNLVDQDWLNGIVKRMSVVFTLDNHYLSGGQGDSIQSCLAVAGFGESLSVRKLGVSGIPQCGSNEEVLRVHRMDAASIAGDIVDTLSEV